MDVGRINPPLNRRKIINNQAGVNDTKTTNIVEMQKAFGGKDLNQVLNGMSDPNYAQKMKRVQGAGSDELGKDAFLKLMMAQLKQQDPTNPLKSHEMAAQLAQFSSVEQLTNIRTAIEELGNKDNHDQFKLLDLIGKQVSGDSAQLRRTLGDSEHKVEFSLPASADRATVVIKNAKGQEVKKYELDHLKTGKNIVTWNGLKNDDSEAPVGDYRVEINASKAGKALKAKTKFSGPVDGVTFTKNGPMLMVDGKKLALSDVKSVSRGMELKPMASPINPALLGQGRPVAAGPLNPSMVQGGAQRMMSGSPLPSNLTNPMGPNPTPEAIAALMGTSANGPMNLNTVKNKNSAARSAVKRVVRKKGHQPGRPMNLPQKPRRTQLQPENKQVFTKPHLKHPQVRVDSPIKMKAMNKRFSKGAYEQPKIQEQMTELKMAGELKQKIMEATKQL